MKRILIIFVIGISVLCIAHSLINKYFFKSGEDKIPVLTQFKESAFEIIATKPFYYSIDGRLYFSSDGKLSAEMAPIWKGKIEKAYISPDSRYALLYAKNKLTLIDNKGNNLMNIDNCTGLYTVQEERLSGRFVSEEVQWDKSSRYFLISQDRIWGQELQQTKQIKHIHLQHCRTVAKTICRIR